MTNALERAYASNEETPIHTLEIIHSGLTGGVLRIAQSFSDVSATLEDSTSATFTAAGINILPPEKSTDGGQELSIEIDNSANDVWPEIQAAVTATRTTAEEIVCKYRAYLLSDTSAPAGGVLRLIIRSGTIDRVSASFRAEFAPIPDTTYPRKRYYPTTYPGVKYA